MPEPRADLARLELHHERPAVAHAAEMLSGIVVAQHPGLRVVGSEDADVVSVVQTGCVVEAVVNDDAGDVSRFAEVHLPPRVFVEPSVEAVFAVLHTVATAGGAGLRRERRASGAQRFGVLGQSSSMSFHIASPETASSRGEVEAGVSVTPAMWSLMAAALLCVQTTARASQTNRVARTNLAHGFRMPCPMVRQCVQRCHREIAPGF